MGWVSVVANENKWKHWFESFPTCQIEMYLLCQDRESFIHRSKYNQGHTYHL